MQCSDWRFTVITARPIYRRIQFSSVHTAVGGDATMNVAQSYHSFTTAAAAAAAAAKHCFPD